MCSQTRVWGLPKALTFNAMGGHHRVASLSLFHLKLQICLAILPLHSNLLFYLITNEEDIKYL